MATIDKAAIAAFVVATLAEFATQKLGNHVDELKKRLSAKFSDVPFGDVIIDNGYWYVVAGKPCCPEDMITPKTLAA